MISNRAFLGLLKANNKNYKSFSVIVNLNTIAANEVVNEEQIKKKKPLSEYLKIKKASDLAEFKQPGSIYDPPYIIKEKPFPNHDILNIHFISYDYTRVDFFYRNIASLCKTLNIEVIESYAQPARSFNIKSLKPYSTTVDQEYKLQKYHRIVRVKNLKSTLVPILLESIQLNLPEGVELYLAEPSTEEDEFRYIPDLDISDLKKQIEEIGNE